MRVGPVLEVFGGVCRLNGVSVLLVDANDFRHIGYVKATVNREEHLLEELESLLLKLLAFLKDGSHVLHVLGVVLVYLPQ